MDTEKGRNDIEFENGKALGTYWAALCLDGLLRTRQFIRGINEAIKEKTNNKKPIHILYAGTGPFATLILPFIFRYSKQDIKYTFLEINPFSFKLLKNVILKLGLEEYNISLINSDATKYQVDSKNEPDIIISETMQNALAKEQQVPIFLNLMRQVKNETIFIPEKINLFIGLKKAEIPLEEIQSKDYKKEMKVFEVSKESMFPSNNLNKATATEVSFTKKQTIIRNEKLKGFNQIVIITEIQVYKNEKIEINESGLTTPLFIKDIPNDLKSSISIDTQYIISSEPKLEYKITYHTPNQLA
ncbi:hypothetical protein BX611_0147 [Lutibacter oceani]|uniref:Uncharacterized protein n=1 Tax=Lutibacter oceani TaxID=1853311 RepID=A0A3D9S2K4_9FLAO|nr:hypothetical protein [Lutibacter oceani]REE82872.1 hypothetical protein BX611_0147 [Lutibacter oceani]